MKFEDRVAELLAKPLRYKLNIVRRQDCRPTRRDRLGGGFLFRRIVFRLGVYGGGRY